MTYKIAIVRPDGTPVDLKFYNSQEVGLAKGLMKLGVSVDVYVAGAEECVEESEISFLNGVTVRLFRVPFFKVPEIDHAIYPKLFKLLKNNQYDLIQVNEESEINNYLVSRMAKKINVPVIIYQGMYKQIDGRIRAFFQYFFDKLILPSFKKNVVLAACKTTRAEKHLQAKGFKNTTVIPVGLDEGPFLENESLERNWKNECGIPDGKHILLYVGILENRRNIHFLLDLVKELGSDKYHLLIAGKGPIQESIENRIKAENLQNVSMLGRIEQKYLPSLYGISDLFMLASNYEIYGMVVLEAMFHGVPLCSTRTAGPEDLIINNEDGLLFDDLSIKSWVTSIKDVIDNGKLLEMSKRSKEKVKNSLTWDGVAKKYYQEIILNYCTKS
tara:strand:+ start:342 stop:1499 length:1158 start_codon:yes stop_codon:yes gene_type:complete